MDGWESVWLRCVRKEGLYAEKAMAQYGETQSSSCPRFIPVKANGQRVSGIFLWIFARGHYQSGW